jgi:hypothetical protein
VLDMVLAELDTTPQRHANRLARRFPIMSTPTRVATAAAMLAVVVVTAYALLPNDNVGPTPSGSPTGQPSGSPLPTPSEPGVTVLPLQGDLEPGTYSLPATFPVSITFEVPEGWRVCSSGTSEQAVCGTISDTEPGRGVSFVIVDNLAEDPCTALEMDPPVGPSVEDLVQAIRDMDGFDTTELESTTVDGLPARRIELRAGTGIGCDTMATWSAGGSFNRVSRDELDVLRILDVDGVRLLIAAAYLPDFISPDALTELQAVVDSISIGQ